MDFIYTGAFFFITSFDGIYQRRYSSRASSNCVSRFSYSLLYAGKLSLSLTLTHTHMRARGAEIRLHFRRRNFLMAARRVVARYSARRLCGRSVVVTSRCRECTTAIRAVWYGVCE